MKKQIEILRNNKNGFMMITSLLVLLVLTLLGIAVNKNTTTEWQIAMNDRLHQDAFYSAEAAAELAATVAAWGKPCTKVKVPGITDGYHAAVIDSTSFDDFTNTVATPSDNDRDLVFPAVFNGTNFNPTATNEQPHANINLGGDTELSEGSAIQMAAGYEGLGKGIGTGYHVLYDIRVQQVGQNGSISVICAKYRVKGVIGCDDTTIYE